MSFTSKCKVLGKEYNVLNVKIKMARSVSSKAMPSSETKGGQAIITVESTGDCSIMEWMCDSYRTEDGQIDWFRPDQNSVMKNCSFKEAYCVKYEQNYNSTDETSMTETFTISAKEISMGNAVHVNKWEAVGA